MKKNSKSPTKKEPKEQTSKRTRLRRPVQRKTKEVFCSAFVFGQSSSNRPASTAESPATSNDLQSAHGCRGNLEILSDTQDVDFGPYLQVVLHEIRHHWHKLIPEPAVLKKGKVAIEFAIKKDGHVTDMCLVAPSGTSTLIIRHGQYHQI